ncbi:MAG: DegV family protein [Clostridiales bacterium]|nr:DegV family protein [Clostridiales bacterium]
MNKKIAITTDSSSGILPNECTGKNVFLLPLPFLINGECYFENVNLTQDVFYEKLAAGADVSTSQPSLGELTEFWTDVLKSYDEIVHIPLSSGLSQSCASATALAKDFNGKVHVVNNRRVSVTLKQSVFDAEKLANQGKSALEIKEYLEETADDSSIYIAVDTMKYLKKGGRVTPAAAMIGTILKIKPVLQIHGDKLDKYALARGNAKAKDAMKAAMKKDVETKFAKLVEKGELALYIAHSANESEAVTFQAEIQALFPNIPVTMCEPLSPVISCHIGPGSLAVAASRFVK